MRQNGGGGASRLGPGAAVFGPEFVYNTGAFDWFKFANHDARFPGEIERLLTSLAPDVVHFHHFVNFGVEVFQHVRRVLPDCRIILTLHEFLAICHDLGQMVTARHFNLCYRSGDARCHDCFPQIARSDFFLRKRYILWYLDLVDVFVRRARSLRGATSIGAFRRKRSSCWRT